MSNQPTFDILLSITRHLYVQLFSFGKNKKKTHSAKPKALGGSATAFDFPRMNARRLFCEFSGAIGRIAN